MRHWFVTPLTAENTERRTQMQVHKMIIIKIIRKIIANIYVIRVHLPWLTGRLVFWRQFLLSLPPPTTNRWQLPCRGTCDSIFGTCKHCPWWNNGFSGVREEAHKIDDTRYVRVWKADAEGNDGDDTTGNTIIKTQTARWLTERREHGDLDPIVRDR